VIRPALLDVNVLIALFNQHHVHHEPAHDWFADHQGQPWATCPLTENAFLRILSDPSQRSALITLPTLADHLGRFCRDENHEFWPDAVSMYDETVFDVSLVRGHRQLTDVYLLGLAVKRGGRLITFDQSIPLAAVKGATRASLEVVAPAE
jgi:toxin-antitoxin system PIN domain toxin